MAGEVVLEVSGVEFRYGAQAALAGVTFSVATGSFLGIIGPNAAGKSTLLRTLAATLRPQRGVVLLRGRDVGSFPRRDLARTLSVVPQETSTTFPYSALEVVLMGRYPHLGRFRPEGRRDLAAAHAAMETAGCWHLRDRSFVTLSGGERQRVVLARALAQEPEILILDEPTAHLDIGSQIDLLDAIKELNVRRKLTVVAVFHDLNLASQYSDELLLLHEGKVFAFGPPGEVLTPDNIRSVYGTDVLVTRHPLTGVPQVVLLPRQVAEVEGCAFSRVHLICGGGVGASLLACLKQKGARVTAGVLNIGDTDWEVARLLEIPVAAEKPFSPVSRAAYEANLALAGEAMAVFLLEVPIGHGNLPNVAVLEPLLEAGKKCFLVDPEHFPERDYTEGRAMHLVSLLREKGLAFLSSQQEVLQVVSSLRKEVTSGTSASREGSRPGLHRGR